MGETARRGVDRGDVSLSQPVAREHLSDQWRVPTRVEADGEVVTVTRAWPAKAKDGVARVTVEGRDRRGRLRAGTVGCGGRVRLLPSGTDPKLPALERLAAEGELVVHRAGRRAVLRHTGGYTKVVRPGRSEGVASAASTGRALAAAAGLAAREVLHHDAELATVTMSVLPGRPVHELAEDPAWAQVWQTWAEAWERLQILDPNDLGPTPTAPGPTSTGPEPTPTGPGPAPTGPALLPHTATDEAGVVRQWADRALATGVLPGEWVARTEHAQQLLHAQGDPVLLVPTHRDLHDKQLLWDGSALGVLDLDTACVADPALDPANLAVHADLRRVQGLWPSPSAQLVGDVARAVARAARVDDDRWRTAQLATVARLVCVYAFRPSWRDTVLAWAEERWEELGGR